MRSMIGKMIISASVNCDPQRNGPESNFCRSELMSLRRESNCFERAVRCVGEGLVRTLWKRAGRWLCLWMN